MPPELSRVYRVVIRHNLVVAIEVVPVAQAPMVAETPLQASTALARNHLAYGRIDGDYYVRDSAVARDFASLSLDFAKRVLEKSIEALNIADLSGAWRNPHAPSIPDQRSDPAT